MVLCYLNRSRNRVVQQLIHSFTFSFIDSWFLFPNFFFVFCQHIAVCNYFPGHDSWDMYDKTQSPSGWCGSARLKLSNFPSGAVMYTGQYRPCYHWSLGIVGDFLSALDGALLEYRYAKLLTNMTITAFKLIDLPTRLIRVSLIRMLGQTPGIF